MHHTALNLASLDRDDRRRAELFDFTNELCARYHLAWINEDLGFWSVAGRPVPYPLPPVLDGAGLAACVRNVRACQRALAAPLVVEFPGFAEGVSLVLGEMDAYDFFRRVAEETGVAVNLDVAHLLSWRWWRGLRGEALFGDLERLPLAACFEIHLSGCEIADDRFVDAHHGRLLAEQIQMLERLLPVCPNLRAVTFEDPRLAEAGMLAPGSEVSLTWLERAVADWKREPAAKHEAAETTVSPITVTFDQEADGHLSARRAKAASPPQPIAGGSGPLGGPELEVQLALLLFDREARARWRRDPASSAFPLLDAEALEQAAAAVRGMVRQRTHRGTGPVVDLFPRSLAGWRALAPEDVALDELFARFLGSPFAASWREQPGGVPGACLEDCFGAFLVAAGLARADVCEDELLSAMLRTLAVTPEPGFVPPRQIRRVPHGWYAISSSDPPKLFAAIDGRYIHGEITPLVAACLTGTSIEAAAAAHGAAPNAVAAVARRLVEMKLL